MDRPIASDLSYFCLQKQRRELQSAHLSPEQPSQGSDFVTLSGTRGEIARSFFSGDVSGGGFNTNPPSRAIGEREQ